MHIQWIQISLCWSTWKESSSWYAFPTCDCSIRTWAPSRNIQHLKRKLDCVCWERLSLRWGKMMPDLFSSSQHLAGGVHISCGYIDWDWAAICALWLPVPPQEAAGHKQIRIRGLLYKLIAKSTHCQMHVMTIEISVDILPCSDWRKDVAHDHFPFTKGGFLNLLIVIFSEILGLNHKHSQ